MTTRTAVTVDHPRDEVERRWNELDHAELGDASVTFRDAPGDRGTEIHVEVGTPRGGALGMAVQKVTGTEPLAKAKDHLRHFKQLAEAGVITRSDGSPEGEQLLRKFKQRPAQPLEEVSAG